MSVKVNAGDETTSERNLHEASLKGTVNETPGLQPKGIGTVAQLWENPWSVELQNYINVFFPVGLLNKQRVWKELCSSNIPSFTPCLEKEYNISVLVLGQD